MPKSRTKRVSSKNLFASSKDEDSIEELESESVDEAYSPPTYDIVTYPADFTLEVLATKLAKKPVAEIQIPTFQRGFVWTQVQGSKLIESFLLGLPVPPVFLYTSASNIQMVVDGQQRLKTIGYFFEGYFGPEDRGRRPIFRLTGLNEKSPYVNCTAKDLENLQPDAFRKLKDAVLRAFVIKQLNPNDDTSVFHVFERLNTGGTFLTGQEIRNCVYSGPFNDLLLKLNVLSDWRLVFGKNEPDKRQRDVELILRFFALRHDLANYAKPMKEFLSNFMARQKAVSKRRLKEYETEFSLTMSLLVKHLGEKPFHLRSGLNAAAFDSVSVTFAERHDAIKADTAKKYKKLIEDAVFQERTRSATTDEDAVVGRIERSRAILFGEK
ncbi:MAG: DUF262 domain-containing protein [Pirellulaceae bacterium]|nr:DUF262 domain-containing protein [Pirellulaceae bacterium]